MRMTIGRRIYLVKRNVARHPSRFRRGPGYTESPDGGRRPAASPCPRSDRLGSGPNPGACSGATRTTSSSRSSPSSGRSTAATSTRRSLLKRLPSTGERVLQGPGENAGVLDLGDGTAVAFKVESHNHPSAVEPFQGAATGIGGILRDVIAMGARPIALLDGLWFGEPDFHFRQAVAGIGHYGNCVGVPTVGGQTVFDPAYASNCLVNAMCVGLLDSARLALGEGERAGAARRPLRRDDRPRRDRRRFGARERRAERGRHRQAPVGPGRRSRSPARS